MGVVLFLNRGSSFKINADKSSRACQLELVSGVTIAAKSIRAERTIFDDERRGDHDFDACSILDPLDRSSSFRCGRGCGHSFRTIVAFILGSK